MENFPNGRTFIIGTIIQEYDKVCKVSLPIFHFYKTNLTNILTVLGKQAIIRADQKKLISPPASITLTFQPLSFANCIAICIIWCFLLPAKAKTVDAPL